MKTRTAILLCLLMISFYALGEEQIPSPYDNGIEFSPVGEIDRIQLENLGKYGIKPAKMCSDGVFLRRAYLDLIGTVPPMADAEAFLADNSPEKRSKLIDSLLQREEFSKYWTLKWGDVLRIKSEFPVNLWPDAAYAYSQWIWQAMEKNIPYDKFARELLTSSGSNFRDPPVNFYRATQDRSPSGLAKVAVLAFLGSRLQNWPESDRKEVEKLFSRVSYKKTDEWKEEIVYLNPEPGNEISARMPDGTTIRVKPGDDPRAAFADWLTGPAKKWFARAAVNRVWFWLFGRGLVQEPDDFTLGGKGDESSLPLIGFIMGGTGKDNLGNPPCNPELLDFLAEEFIRSGYDFRQLLRIIANSATYQQSCIPSSDLSTAEKYFAVYPVRRLDAEVIVDALCYLAQAHPKYTSMIPEPFTFLPDGFRAIGIFDGSISSSLLETFGRPARDTGYLLERNNDPTYSQRLFLLNSTEVQNNVTGTPFLKEILHTPGRTPEDIVNRIYLLVLSRYPTREEFETVMANFGEEIPEKPRKKGAEEEKKVKKYRFRNANFSCRQLIWALVNSKEFIFRH